MSTRQMALAAALAVLTWAAGAPATHASRLPSDYASFDLGYNQFHLDDPDFKPTFEVDFKPWGRGIIDINIMKHLDSDWTPAEFQQIRIKIANIHDIHPTDFEPLYDGWRISHGYNLYHYEEQDWILNLDYRDMNIGHRHMILYYGLYTAEGDWRYVDHMYLLDYISFAPNTPAPPIPLPAPAVLLIGALASFGLVARRRRAAA